jgi:hypothetical protein
MSPEPIGARALRATLYGGGAVATAAGVHTMVAGARSIPGRRRRSSPDVESELRFYAAFYAAYGVAALRAAPRAHTDTAAVRALAGTLFLAGLARAGAWRAAGRPNAGQLALLAIELAAPPAILAGQARLRAIPAAGPRRGG